MCIPFPHPFVAASSSRHPLSSAVGASQFSPGREAWVSYPTQPLPSFRPERPGFFFRPVSGRRVAQRGPPPHPLAPFASDESPNPYRHSERSRPIFSFAFAPAKASACECEESLRAAPSPRAFLRALNLSPSFVAASSPRHPRSNAGGASRISPGREAWVPRTTQPQPVIPHGGGRLFLPLPFL